MSEFSLNSDNNYLIMPLLYFGSESCQKFVCLILVIKVKAATFKYYQKQL